MKRIPEVSSLEVHLFYGQQGHGKTTKAVQDFTNTKLNSFKIIIDPVASIMSRKEVSQFVVCRNLEQIKNFFKNFPRKHLIFSPEIGLNPGEVGKCLNLLLEVTRNHFTLAEILIDEIDIIANGEYKEHTKNFIHLVSSVARHLHFANVFAVVRKPTRMPVIMRNSGTKHFFFKLVDRPDKKFIQDLTDSNEFAQKVSKLAKYKFLLFE